jgi:hypothetical protein
MAVSEERYLYEHRMPEAELIRQAQEALEEAGIGNAMHTRLLHAVCKEVMESVDPLFAQLLPTVLPTNNRAWLKAYSLVLEYLAQHELELTVDTFATELDATRFPTQIPSDSGVSFSQLVSSIQERVPFRERVRLARPVRKQKKLSLKQSTPQKRKGTPKSKTPTAEPTADVTPTASQDLSDSDVIIDKVTLPQ